MMDSLNQFVFTFFNLEVAREYAGSIFSGAIVTLYTGLAIVVTGTVCGILLALLRALGCRPMSWLIIAFADIFRALPPLVLLIVMYFGMPALNMPMSAFTVTWLSLSLVLTAYAEESVWAGIASLNKGQMEAARSTGMKWLQAMMWVVLPQAIRRAIPTLTNRIISITKNTALGSVVALNEILNNAQGASSYSGNPTPLVMAAIAYLAIFLPLVVFSRWLETRWASC